MEGREAEARIGESIDRYRIEGVLGTGGFGAVFRARHVVMDRVVALKLLHGAHGAREDMRERFLREARTLGRIGHPNVVGVHDSGITAAGEAFVVMELLDGEDLAARLERVGRLGVDDALRIADAVLDGLGAVHAAGIVHRDLKPANVFLAKSPHGDVPKLVDFGISKLEDDRMTRTGLVLGTPIYMAPESFLVGAAGVDARADLYAVGVILYELLSGLLPYDAPSYEALVLKIATCAPPPFAMVAPGAPPRLAALVDRAMARDPAHRFADAVTMRVAIADVRSSTVTAWAPSTPMPYGASPVPRGKAGPNRLMILGATFGGLGLLGIAAAALLVVRSFDRTAATPTALALGSTQFDASGPSREPDVVALAPEAIDGKPTFEGDETAVTEKELAEVAGSAVVPPPVPEKPTEPSAPPARGGGTVRMREPNVVGEAPIGAVYDRFESSRRSLERCRRDVDETVYVQLMVHDGRIALAGPNPNERSSDVEVARCVANVMRDGGALPSGQGILQLAFDLDAR